MVLVVVLSTRFFSSKTYSYWFLTNENWVILILILMLTSKWYDDKVDCVRTLQYVR